MPTILPSQRPRPQAAAPDPAQTLATLSTIVILVLTVAVLYLARDILVPIAIAILLSFVLSPLVRLLRNLGFGRTLSVGTVVFLAFVVAIGLGAILGKQISDLAAEAPKYQATAMQKIEATQTFIANSPVLNRLNVVITDLTHIPPAPEQKAKPSPDVDNGGKTPLPVEIVSPAPDVLKILQTAVGAAASPVATAAFVAIFIVFILLQREDLRNRFIRLVGSGDLQLTTLAMNDAAKRLSRYFLAQVLLNTSFGLVIACALSIIGVPSAILWGIVAIFMRFIPYIGSIGSALFPVTMAALAAPGWSMVIETVVLFAIAEFIVGQVIEPLVYGHHTGISPIAVVASATFWTWLWGPVGLVLSTPLTVCLVVMGRHVDRLAFLDVLLGDAPPLTPVESFYQRLLAGDPSEIADHAESYLRDHTLLDYCDHVAMPALLMAQTDVRRGALEETRQTRIRDTMSGLVDDIADHDDDLLPLKIETDHAPASLDDDAPGGSKPTPEIVPRTDIDPAWAKDNAVICVAGRTPLDEAAAHLLSDLLKTYGIGTHVEPAESFLGNAPSALSPVDAQLVMLSFLDADLSTAQARFSVRRLRRRVPNIPIVAAFWMAEQDEARITGLCSDVRCDTCVSNIPQAIRLCLERAEAKPGKALTDHEGTDDSPAPAKMQLSNTA